MIEAAFAQLRFALSVALGVRFSPRSLERLTVALRETKKEFGSAGKQGKELFDGPVLDEQTRRDIQLRRFRALVKRATSETPYYKEVFSQLDIVPAQMKYEDISRIPITPREALRNKPTSFVCRTAKPYLCASTTGTTGRPASIYFSAAELRIFFALSAVAALFSGQIEEDDIVQISTSTRGTLGNLCLAGACAHIGAVTYLAGVIEPERTLALLREERDLPGKRNRASVLYTYPSYLGELITVGLNHGYQPSDFGLRRIIIGGEIVTAGLKARVAQLFGAVDLVEGYGMTEIWPLGGAVCEDGHLHFEVSHGFIEVCDPETGTPVKPGETGTIVATPFTPYRESTLLLRYDTGDAVRLLKEPLTCKLRHLPATSNLLGKQALAVRHENGWVYTRDVMEALEGVPELELPARGGFWAAPGGVDVEIVSPVDTPALRATLAERLKVNNVPLATLYLRQDRTELRQPWPLRGDLSENSFQLAPVMPVLQG